MDAADVFRPGHGFVISRPPQTFYTRKPPPPQHRDDISESDTSSHRIAHTLTACCRCRQRKTRCDPTLPRCLPCERSGSTCEYFDTTKGRKISRFYVVKLQEKVRQLEAELAQYTDEDNEYPRNNEDMVRPGGLVRLNESDETPRYLGPSSGIAMTRLLMEGAKRFTESTRISELVPDVRARRLERMNQMQSVSYNGGAINPSPRKKSYPLISAHPAQGLPKRPLANKLLEVFIQRAQVLTPILHEKVLASDLEHVFAGSNEPYKNFTVRMMMAISLQKLDTQYAGLADSFYLSSMQYFEDVIRPKDLKTLQCLALIGQYSLLTPTRMAVYYIIGLATRICQQLGLDDEKALSAEYSMGLVDDLTMDLRRRMSWIAATQEFGLAHSMGRPNGFSRTDDLMDVKYFADVDDEYVTENGILDAPKSGKKLAAIHFCEMRLLQAEIRRTLYERKRPEPKNDSDPWFARMQERTKEWLAQAPEEPTWCRPWFTGRYHTMVVFLHRPSPQIPKPSPQASLRCFDSSSFLLKLFNQQVKKSAVDVTWVLLITIYMALNTLLWSISYQEVRAAHPRDELEELVNMALIIMDQCSERWPGVGSVSQLYSVFAQACMQSYEARPEKQQQPQPPSSIATTSALNTPPSLADTSSPSASEASNATSAQQSQPPRPTPPLFNAPQFGYVFDSTPEPIPVEFSFDPDSSPFQNPQPTFRSNSIFMNPASSDSSGRRFSYFPPEATHHPGEAPLMEPAEEPTPPATATPFSSHASPPIGTPSSNSAANPLPTPPSSLLTPPLGHSTQNAGGAPMTLSATSPALAQASPRMLNLQGSPAMPHSLPVKSDAHGLQDSLNPLQPAPPASAARGTSQPPTTQTSQQQRTPTFTIPPPPQQHNIAAGTAPQRQLPPPPTTVTDWFRPPPPFISPYAFSSAAMTGGFWGDSASAAAAVSSAAFPGLHAGAGDLLGSGGYSLGAGGGPGAVAGAWNGAPDAIPQFTFPGLERHGSLSQQQQAELMDVLETEGMGEIDAFLMDLGEDGVPAMPPSVSGETTGGPQGNGIAIDGPRADGNGMRWQ